jgi:hypothetical protein
MQTLIDAGDWISLKKKIDFGLEKRRLEREKKGIVLVDKFKTDIGYLIAENLDYLYSYQKLLISLDDGNYGFRYGFVQDSTLPRPLAWYSAFRLVVDDIQETTGVREIDAVVTIMREGNMGSRPYPRVDSILNKGKMLAIQTNRDKGGSKKQKDSYGFGEL